MKQRAVFFLLCVLCCFSSLSLSSSAADDDLELFVYSDEISEQSDSEEWLYDEEGDYYYIPEQPNYYTNDEMPGLMLLESPNYPDFDINHLPWSTAPAYITDILYNTSVADASAALSSGTGDYKMPFVCVAVTSSYIRVIVGVNLALGCYCATSTSDPAGVYVCGFPTLTNSYPYTTCYESYYYPDTYECFKDWTKLSSSAVGDKGNVVRFTGNICTPSSTYDYYVYGGNGYSKSVTSVAINVYESSTQTINLVVNNNVGFESGRYLFRPDIFTSAYFKTFTPPTAEQQEQETSKGIWQTLKELPGVIADKFKAFFDNLLNGIKSIFIPSSDFFDTYQEQLQEFFKARLGVVYQVGDLVISLFDKLINFNPQEDNFVISFPAVDAPSYDFNSKSVVWHSLIPETSYSFSDLVSTGVFKTLYQAYMSMVKLLFIFMAIKLFTRKANEVFGGGSSE